MAPSGSSAAVDGARRDLFRYLTAEESAGYLAIMDMFSATLLTDLSAGEVAGQLGERGVSLEARCRQLAATHERTMIGPEWTQAFLAAAMLGQSLPLRCGSAGVRDG